MAARQFFGIQITLVGNAVTNLLKALQAVDPSIPPSARALTIQADVGVTGTLLIGDAAISTTRYGLALISTASLNPFIQYGTESIQAVPVGAFYLLSTANMKVNVLGWV